MYKGPLVLHVKLEISYVDPAGLNKYYKMKKKAVMYLEVHDCTLRT